MMNNVMRVERLETKIDGNGGPGAVMVVTPRNGETDNEAEARTRAEEVGIDPGHVIFVKFVKAIDGRPA
jgi:hypothetical protein